MWFDKDTVESVNVTNSRERTWKITLKLKYGDDVMIANIKNFRAFSRAFEKLFA